MNDSKSNLFVDSNRNESSIKPLIRSIENILAVNKWSGWLKSGAKRVPRVNNLKPNLFIGLTWSIPSWTMSNHICTIQNYKWIEAGAKFLSTSIRSAPESITIRRWSQINTKHVPHMGNLEFNLFLCFQWIIPDDNLRVSNTSATWVYNIIKYGTYKGTIKTSHVQYKNNIDTYNRKWQMQS